MSEDVEVETDEGKVVGCPLNDHAPEECQMPDCIYAPICEVNEGE